MKSIIIVLLTITIIFAVPVRIGVIRGGFVGGDWNHAAQLAVGRAIELVEYADGLDIILFPEFAFAGIDGGSHTRPEVTFTWDSTLGYVPHPLDSTDPGDVSTAHYLDTLRYIAQSETCYIWAATCGEVIAGINYNTIPIFHPDGRLVRFRRKCQPSSTDIVRDTTIYPDTVYVKYGAEIAVMTTICYENSRLDDLLDPVDPPSPLWLLPHGTWSAAGDSSMLSLTQRWSYLSTPISFAGIWDIVTDGWVREDAILVSVDIYNSSRFCASRINNHRKLPIAYEPLAWVDIQPYFFVVDINIPAIDDTLPILYAYTTDFGPESLMVMPEISSGPVFIMGADCDSAIIFDNNKNIIETIEIQDGEGVWIGAVNGQNPPGEYIIKCGRESRRVLLDH